MMGKQTTVAALLLTTSIALGQGTIDFSELVEVTTPDLVVSHSEHIIKNGKKIKLNLDKIGASGDVIDGVTFGELLDINGNPILNPDTKKPIISNDPDFTSILFDKETKSKMFSLTHFERPNPGMAYLTHINHNKDDCRLEPVKYEAVRMENEGGIWTPCSGSVTPWGSHLGSEEYEPDARAYEKEAFLDENLDGLNNGDKYIRWQMSFFGFDTRPRKTTTPTNLPNITEWQQTFFPYIYGHPWEFTVLNPNGDYEIVKRYALGRVAFEMCLVGPDSKTVYCTDDGKNVGFFKFVADKEEDLESGALSCAIMTQTSEEKGGSFNVSWVELARVTNAAEELGSKAKTTRFSDIFSTAEYNNGCPDGFSAVQVQGDGVECLMLRDDSEETKKLAAFFETRRYCAMKGGTTEFNKWEGITYDAATKTVYTAMSTVENGMTDSPDFDVVTGNHVRVEENVCGCIYAMPFDKDGNIDKMRPEVCGVKTSSGQCELDGIAQPDNVVMLHGYNKLFIAEDGDTHVVDGTWYNYLWTYDLTSKELTRIAIVPAGAEVTGPTGYHFATADQCDYFLLVNQHPSTGNAAVHFLSAKDGSDAPPSPGTTSKKDDDELTAAAKVGITGGVFAAGLIFFFIILPRLVSSSKEEQSEGNKLAFNAEHDV